MNSFGFLVIVILQTLDVSHPFKKEGELKEQKQVKYLLIAGLEVFQQNSNSKKNNKALIVKIKYKLCTSTIVQRYLIFVMSFSAQ